MILSHFQKSKVLCESILLETVGYLLYLVFLKLPFFFDVHLVISLFFLIFLFTNKYMYLPIA